MFAATDHQGVGKLLLRFWTSTLPLSESCLIRSGGFVKPLRGIDMFKELIQTFRKPSAEIIAQAELEEARRQLLAAQSGSEYAKALVLYHTQRIERLQKYVLAQR